MSKKLITPMLLAVLLTACSLHYGMTASASEIDGTPSPVPDIASAADNALYWINEQKARAAHAVQKVHGVNILKKQPVLGKENIDSGHLLL